MSYNKNMNTTEQYGELASASSIEKTVGALAQKGITAVVVENGKAAKEKALEIIPAGAEVMNMTSMTLEHTGIADALAEQGKFDFVREKLEKMDDKTQATEKRRLGAAPEWVVGSIHALTEAGEAMIASATGSQLPAYAYGSAHVIWVVGTQKIVKNIDEGMRRIYEYTFPLENERAHKAYGMGSGVNKILIVNREFAPGRITIILVKEKLGF